MRIANLFILAALLAQPHTAASRAPGASMNTYGDVPICAGGRAPVTKNLRLDQVPIARLLVAADGASALAERSRARHGICLGLAGADIQEDGSSSVVRRR